MVDRFEDIYQFNIEGNFERELENLRSGIESARSGFANLKREVSNMGASFSTSKAQIKDARDLLNEFGQEAIDAGIEVLPLQKQLASSSKVLATAYNALATEAEKLAVARAKESFALEQQRRKADPQIIQARAEAAALKSLTKQLENEATKREFRNLAAKNGLSVSADGRRLFNLEATAAERVAKAVEKLGIAEATRKGLAAKGLDPAGKPILATDGKLTQAGEEEAQRRAQAALTRKALKERTDALLGVDNANKKVTASTSSMRSELLDANQEAEKSDRTFNRISFTFRRLVGILAVFAAARAVVSGFKNMISGAVEFNAQLETARVGIAGLIAAAGEVRGPNSQKLGLDDQVLRSQSIAIDQMEKLRRDALLTAASYDELARAFSTAVAPGIQSGLTLDQIRKVTVDISQAATGLGLAQDQLAEEIRALFQGTITPRNTRIATALGISNEDINRAKELGTLFEFLQTRFAAISKTGKLLLNTFTAQLSNASDAFKQLLATSSQPLFEQLKAGLKEVQDAIFTTTKDAVVFDPGVLAAFRGLFEGLAQGVRGIRTAFAQIDIKGFAATLSTIGNIVGTIATALANTFTLFFNTASPTLNVLGEIVKILSSMAISLKNATGLLGTFVKAATGSVAKFALLLFTINKISGAVRGIGGFLAKNLALTAVIRSTTAATAASLTLSQVAARGLFTILSRIGLPLLVIGAGIALIDGVLATFGSKTSIGSILSGAFDTLSNKILGISDDVKGLKAELSEPIDIPLGNVKNDFRDLRSGLAEVSEDAAKALEQASRSLQGAIQLLGSPSGVSGVIQARLDAENELLSRDQVRNTLKQLDQSKKLREAQENDAKRLSALRKQLDGEIAASVETQKNKLEELRAKYLSVNDEFIQVSRKLNKLPDTVVNTLARAPLLGAKERLNAELAKIQDEINRNTGNTELGKRNSELVARELSLKGAIAESDETIKTLETDILNLKIAQDKITQKTQLKLSKEDAFGTEQRVRLAVIDLQAAEAALASAESGGNSRSEAAQKLVAFAQVQAQNANAIRELNKGIVDLEDEILTRKRNQANVDSGLVDSLTRQKDLRTKERDLVLLTNSAREKTAELEARIAKARLTGTASQGLQFGLANFAAQNDSSFNIGERFGQDLANGITEFGGRAISESVVAAFDPSRNFNLRESLGNLALQLGQGLLTDVLKQGLSSLLQSLGVSITGSLSGISVAVAPITAAATGVTTAFTSGATVLGSATTAMISGISTAATAALAAIGAARGAQGASTAASVAGAAGGAFATGGRADAARKILFPNVGVTHRNAPGFSVGGRPRGVDSRDTIPAWLRAGEWVIRPEAVRFYGDRLFDMLNRRRLNPDALRLSGGPKTMPTPKVGFATGGRAVASPRSSPSRVVVNSVNFFDEQTLDRAFASGPEALTRFSRRRRGGMRAALGIDQAP